MGISRVLVKASPAATPSQKTRTTLFLPASFLTFKKVNCRSPRGRRGGCRCQNRSFLEEQGVETKSVTDTEETDLGLFNFGHPALTQIGQSNLGLSVFGSGVCHGGPPRGGPEDWGQWSPKGWALKGGPLKVGPEGWGAQNFAFFPSPASIVVPFFLSLGVFSWNFGGV